MIKARKRKLYLLVLFACLLSLVAGLVLYALRQNISLFYTPVQVSNGEAPLHKNIRLGGMVEKGSILRQNNSLALHFDLTDFKSTVRVYYQGVLPDLFREGQGVVAEGILDSEGFKASRILAKHDENYMPPELKASLNRQESRS